MAVNQLQDYQNQLKATSNPMVRAALQNSIKNLQSGTSSYSAPPTNTTPPQKPTNYSPTTNVTQSGSGYSGRLSASDMVKFQGMSPEQQFAFLQSKSTEPSSTSTPSAPATPYGGYTYGTDPAKDKAMAADEKLYATDPAARQAEIQRTLSVIQDRKSRGLDTSEQMHHLNVTLKYNPDTSTSTTGTNGMDLGSAGMFYPTQADQQQPDYMKLLTQYLQNRDTQAQQQQDAYRADNLQYINKMYADRQSAETAALDQALQTAQQGYNSMETTAKQNAYGQRNQADTINLQNAQRMKEALANAGQNGGTNITAQSNANAQRMGALGDINQQEGNVLNDIAQKRSNLNNSTAQQKLALIQQLQANKSKDLLALNQYIDQRGIQLNNQDYQRFQDAIGNQFNQDKFNYETSPNNPANQAQSIQNQLAQLQLDNYPEQAKAQAKLLQQQVAAGQISNEAAQFNLDQLKDPNSPVNQAQALDVKIKQLEAANLPEQQKLQLQQLRKQIAQIGAAPYRSPEEVKLDKVKLQTAQEQLNKLQNPSSTTEPQPLSDTINQLNKSTFVTVDPKDPNRPKVYDQIGLAKSILSMNRSKQDTDYLFSYYNINKQKVLDYLNNQ